jgi:hypothetical protein
MRLRWRRRGVVVFPPPAGSPRTHGTPWLTRLERSRPIRRCIRVGALLTVIGLVRLARAARVRWRFLLAGAVLTVAGLLLRSGAAGLVFIPGLLLLLNAPFIEARSDEGRKRRSVLERELAGYATPAQQRDLEATLDRYPDRITHELREILASQAVTARRGGIPGAGPY